VPTLPPTAAPHQVLAEREVVLSGAEGFLGLNIEQASPEVPRVLEYLPTCFEARSLKLLTQGF
jgi:hypothetical protein